MEEQNVAGNLIGKVGNKASQAVKQGVQAVGKVAKKVVAQVGKTVAKFIIANPVVLAIIAGIIIIPLLVFSLYNVVQSAAEDVKEAFAAIWPDTSTSTSQNGGISGTAGDIASTAQTIHDYIRENGYAYSLDNLPSTDEELSSFRTICCATYVYWVAKEAGYDVADAPIHGADTLANALKNIGFTEIDQSQMQAGDIQWFPGEHIQISAGDGKYFNAGSDNAIRTQAPSGQGSPVSSGTVILRAPSK